jgi:hypothetical protein
MTTIARGIEKNLNQMLREKEEQAEESALVEKYYLL